MGKYELLSAIKPNLDNDEADKVVAKIEEVIQGFGGSVIDTEKLGRKKSASDIQGYRDSYSEIHKVNLSNNKFIESNKKII